MCGLYGFQGETTNAHQTILQGLSRLEYRGYDSAGLMVGHKKKQVIIKATGKVSSLTNKVMQQISEEDIYTYGIGHTRWATHGSVTIENTHPHVSCNEKFIVAHNGIIENYAKLKKELIVKGHTFYSDTDTEVIAKLLEDQRTGDFLETVEVTLPLLHGAYALLIYYTEEEGSMIGVKLGSPLVFGKGKNGLYFSSDAPTLAGVVDKIMYLEDGELIYAKDGRYTIKAQGKEIFKDLQTFDEKALIISKGDYKHFMLKEIDEQPNVLKRIMKGRVNFDDLTLHAEAFHGMQFEHYEKIILVACGTSHNAAWLGAHWLEGIAGIQADAVIASELHYKNPVVNDKTLYIFVSQSGETADTLAVLKQIQDKGGKTFGIVNVVGSTISRLTDHGLFTRAGSEIGVASTKAFTAQSLCLLLIALFLGKRRNLSQLRYEQIMKHIFLLPEQIEYLLTQKQEIHTIAQDFSTYQNMFFLGRWYQLPIAYEGSLKLKEISYLHSEAFPAGELKHGNIALIDEKTPTVFFCPPDAVSDDNNSSIHEIKARGGKVFTIGSTSTLADWSLAVPETLDELYPILTVIVSQLLAYYTADILEKDIDKPRNLAKSVTVR